MDYVKPDDVAKALVALGTRKAALGAKDLLIRGMLSGGLLGISTSLAMTAAIQTNVPFVGALIFPVGFVIIVLLGLELVTGSFAVVPLARLDGAASTGRVLGNLALVTLGNLIGSVIYGALLAVTLHGQTGGLVEKIVAAADAKTLGYAANGGLGFATALVKAILCNWMVCFGVVMALTSSSTIGKLIGAWLPITVFFAQGFEHLVVNLFVIPTGMMLGAKTTIASWLLWNALPVTIGNVIGGFVCTGLALYATYYRKAEAIPAVVAPRETRIAVAATARLEEPVAAG